jgi:hypothetical protein
MMLAMMLAMMLTMMLLMMLIMMLAMSFMTSLPLIATCSTRNGLEFVWIMSMIFFSFVSWHLIGV